MGIFWIFRIVSLSVCGVVATVHRGFMNYRVIRAVATVHRGFMNYRVIREVATVHRGFIIIE